MLFTFSATASSLSLQSSFCTNVLQLSRPEFASTVEEDEEDKDEDEEIGSGADENTLAEEGDAEEPLSKAHDTPATAEEKGSRSLLSTVAATLCLSEAGRRYSCSGNLRLTRTIKQSSQIRCRFFA